MKQYLSVRFDSSVSRYTYSAPAAEKIVKSDIVVVRTPDGKAKLVQVMDILEESEVSYPLSKVKPIHATLRKL